MSLPSTPIIPTDSPSIYDQLTTLERAAIVRPNNPPRGIAGFLFDYDAEQFLELMSEITDHAIEDNTRVADNIGLLPERVTLRGLIGELTDANASFPAPAPTPAPLPLYPGLFPPFSLGADISFAPKFGALDISAGVALSPGGVDASLSLSGAIGPSSADAILRTVTSELSRVISPSLAIQTAVIAAVTNAVKTISGGNAPSAAAITSSINSAVGNVIGSALTPDVTSLIAQSVNSSLGTTAGTNPGPTAGAASSLYEYYQNRAPVQPGETSQSLAVGYFYQMWRARQMFSVETPWGIMNNMAILSVRMEQPEETRSSTQFSVTFKKIRIAKSVTVNLGQLAGRNAFQASASQPAQNGTTGQTPATPTQEQSWLSILKGP